MSNNKLSPEERALIQAEAVAAAQQAIAAAAAEPVPVPVGAVDGKELIPEGAVDHERVAEWLRDELQDRIGWRDEGRRAWYHHDGQRWRRDPFCDAQSRAITACYKRLVTLDRLTTKEKIKLGNSANKRTIRDYFQEQEGLELPDPDPNVVEFPDGTGYDLLNYDTLPPDAGRFSPGAAVQADWSAPPTRFFTWLNERIPDDCHDHLRAFMRVALFGQVRRQLMLYSYGPPGSGKGTLNDIMTAIAGDYCTAGESKRVLQSKNEPHAQWKMKFAAHRVITLDELSGGRWDGETLQKLVGGDPFAANRMRQDDVTVTPIATVFATSNKAPKVPTDSAMWRRLFPLDMKHAIPEEEQTEEAIAWIAEEAGGILAWVLDGPNEKMLLSRPPSVEALQGVLVDTTRTVDELFEVVLERDTAAESFIVDIHRAIKFSPDASDNLKDYTMNGLVSMIREQRKDVVMSEEREYRGKRRGLIVYGWKVISHGDD